MAKQPHKKNPYQLRKAPSQARAISTVDSILEAAAEIVVQLGYAGASTNAIAERAGVGIGSLYEYFPGKDAIFAELKRRRAKEHFALLTSEPREKGLPEMLRHLTTNHIAFVRKDAALHSALETVVPRFAVEETEEEVLEAYMPLSNDFLEVHSNFVRPSAELPFVSELLMRVLISTVNDYANKSPEKLNDPQLVEQLTEMLSRYLIVEAD